MFAGAAIIVSLLAGAALLGGCRSSDANGSSGQGSSSTDDGENHRFDGQARGVGLELHRAYLPIDAKIRAQGILDATSAGLLEPIESGVSASGFAMYRAPSARLEELLTVLGGSPQLHSTLLGTLPNWADMEAARVGAGRTLFFAGHPRQFPESILRLSLRGWCFPTVDGARARIELRLSSEDPRGERATLDPTTERVRTREIDGGRTVLELLPEQALVVLEIPLVAPDDAESDGLAAAPPPTIASLMLAEQSIAGRATVLIVTTAFADMLPPSKPR